MLLYVNINDIHILLYIYNKLILTLSLKSYRLIIKNNHF